MRELRGGPLKKGDKIFIHTQIGRTGEWAECNDIVEVDYLLPDYGKIIARHTTGKNEKWPTLCLYFDQEGFVWDRLSACPQCKRKDYLDYHSDSVSCDNCRMNFPYEDFIPKT